MGRGGGGGGGGLRKNQHFTTDTFLVPDTLISSLIPVFHSIRYILISVYGPAHEILVFIVYGQRRVSLLTLCMLDNFHAFFVVCSDDFFKINFF